MSTVIQTLLSQLVILALFSSCYSSTGFQSSRSTDIIDEEIEISRHQHVKTKKNYKVRLKNGKTYFYCCVASKTNDVVFFNKIIKKEGQKVYEPHGHFITSINDIKFRDNSDYSENDGWFGGFLFEVLMFSVDVAADAAFSDNSSSDSGSNSGSNSRSSSSSSSKSKTVTGKRSRR